MQIEMGDIEVWKSDLNNSFGIIVKYTLRTPYGFKKECNVSARKNNRKIFTPVTKEDYAEALELIAKQLRDIKLSEVKLS